MTAPRWFVWGLITGALVAEIIYLLLGVFK